MMKSSDETTLFCNSTLHFIGLQLVGLSGSRFCLSVFSCRFCMNAPVHSLASNFADYLASVLNLNQATYKLNGAIA